MKQTIIIIKIVIVLHLKQEIPKIQFQFQFIASPTISVIYRMGMTCSSLTFSISSLQLNSLRISIPSISAIHLSWAAICSANTISFSRNTIFTHQSTARKVWGDLPPAKATRVLFSSCARSISPILQAFVMIHSVPNLILLKTLLALLQNRGK